MRVNGIKVGTVLDQKIDPASFEAVVRMSISPEIKLPDDSSATIDSSGLLGDKFVRLIPGKNSKTLSTDGTGILSNTKTYKSLEQMVGEIIFLATDSGGSKDSGNGKSGGDKAPTAGDAPAPAAGASDKP